MPPGCSPRHKQELEPRQMGMCFYIEIKAHMTYSVLFRLREYWFQDKNKLTSVVLVAALESLKAARSGHLKGSRQGGV